MLVYVSNFILFEFSAAILEKGLLSVVKPNRKYTLKPITVYKAFSLCQDWPAGQTGEFVNGVYRFEG